MRAIHFLFIFCILVLLSPPANSADADYLPYDKFITLVEMGSVKSVSLDRHSQITGVYITDGTDRQFRTFGDTGSANDILLTRLLNQKNVAITLKDQSERSGFFDGPGMFSALLMLLVPIVTLVLVFRINSKLNRLHRNDHKSET